MPTDTPTSTPTPRPTPVACEPYIVKPGDHLWSLAEKYLGSGAAYPAIIYATNQASEIDPSYHAITDSVSPGWKICIPSPEDAADILRYIIQESTPQP